MLFLPECFGFMSDATHKTLDHAEALDDGNATTANNNNVIFKSLQSIAQDYELWISGGGIHEANAPPVVSTDLDDDNEHEHIKPRVYNTHIILNYKGELVSKYRKAHLFDVSIPSKGVNLKESATTAPGNNGIVVTSSPLGMLGLSICYDLRFPEQYTMLTERGAQILLVPSAFTVPTGEAHWHALLRARAIENQCYVIAAAQCGVHNVKRKSYGHSLVVDPWGRIIVDAGGSGSDDDDDEVKVVMCDLDLSLVESVRGRMPIAQHRRDATLM